MLSQHIGLPRSCGISRYLPDIRFWRVSYRGQVHPIIWFVHALDASSCSGTLCGHVVGFGWPIEWSGTWCPTTCNDRNINTTKTRNLFCWFILPAEVPPLYYLMFPFIKGLEYSPGQIIWVYAEYILRIMSSVHKLSARGSCLVERVCLYVTVSSWGLFHSSSSPELNHTPGSVHGSRVRSKPTEDFRLMRCYKDHLCHLLGNASASIYRILMHCSVTIQYHELIRILDL